MAGYKETPLFRNIKNVPDFVTHPPSTIVCGKTGSGKTEIVMNLIKYGLEYKIWDQIIIVSPDAQSEYETFFNKLEEEIDISDLPIIILSTLPKTLEEFMDKVKDINEDNRNIIVLNAEIQTLVIVDDFHAEATSNKFIKQIFTKSRHYGISLVFCTQNFNELHVTVKVNSHYYFFTKNVHGDILQNIEKKCGIENLKKLYEKYMKETKIKYPWILFNTFKNYCSDKSGNIFYLSPEDEEDAKTDLDNVRISKIERNFDSINFFEFKNKFDLHQKNNLRRAILDKFTNIDADILDKMMLSRRNKIHDENIKKLIPEKYWMFWSLK